MTEAQGNWKELPFSGAEEAEGVGLKGNKKFQTAALWC